MVIAVDLAGAKRAPQPPAREEAIFLDWRATFVHLDQVAEIIFTP
jgi:hypothetical protein